MDEELAGDTYLTEVYSDLQKNWFRTNEPYKYVTCNTPWDIRITVDQPLTQSRNEGTCEWKFVINIAENSNKQLWKVILLPECNPNVFHLQSVYIEIYKNLNKKIGKMSNLEWILQNTITMHQQAKRYSVKIKCELEKQGVYRTNVLFNFGEFPAVLSRLCMDYANNMDIVRFRILRKHHLSLLSDRWIDPYFFPTKDEHDIRELNMSNIYPFPDKDNFYLTRDSDPSTTVTRENYRGRLHEIINLEEIAVNNILLQFNDTNTNMLIKTRHEINIELGSPINDSQFELFAKIKLKKKLYDGKECYLFLKGCHHALIKRKDCNVLRVPIVGRTVTSVYLGLYKDCVTCWQLRMHDRVTVDVQFVLKRLKFCNWHWAVDSLEHIHGERFYEKLLLKDVATKEKVETEMFYSEYLCQLDKTYECLHDKIQGEAIYVIINREANDLPILITGHAGTGKKYTIAKSIHVLTDLKYKVLLCTKSDAVADHYISQYFDIYKQRSNWFHSLKKPLRIYDKICNSAMVDPNVLQYCLMDDQKRFREPTEEDLKRHKIIVTTLRDSIYLIHKELHVTHIIIDEADTVAEWEILIPILVANENTRLIFMGELQTHTPDCYSKGHNLSTSILQRLCTHKTYSSNKKFKIFFDTVYRVHPKIAEFIYLEHGREFRQGISAENFPKHPTMATMTFYCVYGKEQEDKSDSIAAIGYKNEAEVKEIVKRVQELEKAWPSDGSWGSFDKQSICILTCFTAQVHKLKKELVNRGINVTVEDVRNIRGMEYTVVFISTVVSHRNRMIDENKNCFISNPALIYTAITRAKNAVAVVGDPEALRTLGDTKCRDLWLKYLKEADLHGMTLN